MASEKNISVGLPETSITFTNSLESGHRHDGITSALVDTSKYSLFDFSPSLTDIKDPERRNTQQSNLNSLRSLVVNVINGSTISPDQINIKANTITATQIAAGTITSTEIASNFILVNNQISSNNYVTGSDGWLISSNGFAEFSNITIRGTVNSNTGVIGGWTIASNGFSSNTSYSNGGIDRISTITMAPAQNSAGTSFLLAQETYTSGTIDVTQYNSLGGQRVISSGIYVDSSTSQTQTLTTSLEQYTISISDDLKWTSNNVTVSSKITLIDPYDADFSGNISVAGTATITGTTNQNGDLYVEYIKSKSGGAGVRIATSGVTGDHVFIQNPLAIASTTGYQALYWNTVFGLIARFTSKTEFKENIEDINDSIALIKNLRPVSFIAKKDENYSTDELEEFRKIDVQYGFLAEDVAEVAGTKLATYELNNGELTPVSWSNPNMTALAIAGVKELIAKIEDLESRLSAVEGV